MTILRMVVLSLLYIKQACNLVWAMVGPELVGGGELGVCGVGGEVLQVVA